MKRNASYFVRQFADVAPQKRARRERFLRKVAGQRQHMREHLRRPRKLSTDRYSL